MKNYNAKDVAAFIAGAPKEAQPKLKEIRKVIKAALPKAEEGISYGMPFYKYHGFVAGFMPFKTYVGFGFTHIFQGDDRKVLEKKGYKTGSKSFQISFDQKVPVTMLRKILKAKAKKNQSEE